MKFEKERGGGKKINEHLRSAAKREREGLTNIYEPLSHGPGAKHSEKRKRIVVPKSNLHPRNKKE